MEDIFDFAEMQQQLTKPLNYKPVSEERYNQLIVPLKAMGVTIMRGGEAVEKHLDEVNAQASNIGTHIVLFREKISISAILEESYHIIQNRQEMNYDKDAPLRHILNEIDAKEYLLKIANRYGIPREEIEETKMQLEQYKQELKKYYEKRGDNNV